MGFSIPPRARELLDNNLPATTTCYIHLTPTTIGQGSPCRYMDGIKMQTSQQPYVRNQQTNQPYILSTNQPINSRKT